MQPGDEERRAYAREQLTAYLVARGIEPALAKEIVSKNVTEFDSVEIKGRRHLMVRYDGRLWPTFNAGETNPADTILGDNLWTGIPYEIRHPRPSALLAAAPPDDSDSPYLEEVDEEAEQRRQLARKVGEFF
jgi:hypothetical protein